MTLYKLSCTIRLSQMEINLEDFHNKEEWDTYTEDKKHSLLYDLTQDLLADYIDYEYTEIENTDDESH